MVIKQKLSDVAADFGKKNKEIIDILSEYSDGTPKKANNVLSEQDLDVIVEKLTQSSSKNDEEKYMKRFVKSDDKKQVKKQPNKNSRLRRLFCKWQSRLLKEQKKKQRKKQTQYRRREQKAQHTMLTLVQAILTLKIQSKV